MSEDDIIEALRRHREAVLAACNRLQRPYGDRRSWEAERAAEAAFEAHLRATRQQAAPEQERPQFDPLPPGKSPRADPSLEWPGPGPEPAKWTAPNGTIVYRSYADYCDD